MDEYKQCVPCLWPLGRLFKDGAVLEHYRLHFELRKYAAVGYVEGAQSMIIGLLAYFLREVSFLFTELSRMAHLMPVWNAVPEDVLSASILHC